MISESLSVNECNGLKEAYQLLHREFVFAYMVKEKQLIWKDNHGTQSSIVFPIDKKNTFLPISKVPQEVEESVGNIQIFIQSICEVMGGNSHKVAEYVGSPNQQEEIHWYKLEAKPVFDDHGTLIKVVGIIYNVSRITTECRKYRERKNLDPVTGLMKRGSIQQVLQNAIESKKNTCGATLAVGVCDLKKINEQYGNEYGDFILQFVVDLLVHFVGANDCIGRIRGSQFYMVFPDKKDEDAIQLAKEILALCKERQRQRRLQIHLELGIGIAMYPYCGNTAREVIRKAEVALFCTQKVEKNSYLFFRDIKDEWKIRQELQKELYTWEESYRTNLAGSIWSMLAKEEDVLKNLSTLLELGGRYLNVDKVSVLEIDLLGKYLYCLEEWLLDEVGETEKNQYLNYSKQITEELIRSFSEETPLLEIEDMSKAQAVTLYRRVMATKGVKASIHYTTFEEGVATYVFRFENYTGTHVWSQEELAFIKSFSKALGTKLHQQQDKRRMNSFMERFVNYDALTKLPAYIKFKGEAEEFMENSGKSKIAVVYTDFKNFKYINDTFGYAVGDEILCEFAEAIKMMAVEDKSMVCRISGDSFASIQTAENKEEFLRYIQTANEDILKILKQKYPDIAIILSSGIYFCKEGDTLTDAIDSANYAKKVAKKNPQGGCRVFDEVMERQLENEAFMLNSLEQAMRDGGLRVHYQPKIDLETYEILGGEGLVRWMRGDGTMLYPDQFIPFCEANGLIAKVDLFVLEQSCIFLKEWIEEGNWEVQISVNLSRYDCLQEGFLDAILGVVERYQVPHHMLEFEVTESVFLEDVTKLGEFLEKLLTAGFGVSVDDFGSGFSSLNILPDIPASIIKLDRVFLQNYRIEKNRVLVKQMVETIKLLGFRTLCEGIEEQQQAEFCKDIHCNMAQGYLFSKPVPVEEFKKILLQRTLHDVESGDV